MLLTDLVQQSCCCFPFVVDKVLSSFAAIMNPTTRGREEKIVPRASYLASPRAEKTGAPRVLKDANDNSPSNNVTFILLSVAVIVGIDVSAGVISSPSVFYLYGVIFV